MKHKQIMAFLFAAVLLTGCGSSSKEVKKETKTCTTEYQGMRMSMKMNAEDDVIKTMDIQYLYSEEMLGFDASKVDKDQLKVMEDTVRTQLGLSGDEEGVKATVKVDGTGMKMDIHVDLMKADSKVLNKFSITGNTKNVKLSETVENAEKGQEGIKFTCK